MLSYRRNSSLLHPMTLLSATGLLLLAQICLVESITPDYFDHSNEIVAFPILPHHAVKARRLRELSESSSDANRNLKAFDDIENDKGRNLKTYQMGSLYQGYGTHYLDLWVGTPPQRQTVIVDTGSGVTAFPCQDCGGCGESYHTDSYFEESKSSSFEKLSCNECLKGTCQVEKSREICHIGMSYQEGSSWSAFEGKDQTYAGGLHERPLSTADESESDDEFSGVQPTNALNYQFPLVFGCQTHLTGLFKTQLADGIMGMDNTHSGVWKQMHDAGVIQKPNFSLCFSRQPTASRKGTIAGSMTFGSTDNRLHSTPMVYAQNQKSGVFYTVKLRKMYLLSGGGESVTNAALKKGGNKLLKINIATEDLNYGGVIVDSGTTDTYMSRGLNAPFQSAWKKITGSSFSNNPISLSETELMQLPTIVFQFAPADAVGDEDYDVNDPMSVDGLAGVIDENYADDVVVVMPAIHYMEYDQEKKKYIPRFYLEESRGSVLGANFMQGHDVTFDIENYRIGFAESDCDYMRLVTGEASKPNLPPYGSDEDKSTCSKSCKVGVGAAVTAAAVGAAWAGHKYYRSHGIEYERTEAEMANIDDDLTMPEFS